MSEHLWHQLSFDVVSDHLHVTSRGLDAAEVRPAGR